MSEPVLLLSPYDALSHRAWREFIEDLPGYRIESVALEPRYFSWRFRGNPLTFSRDERLDGPWRMMLATSMTDLASLKGMRPGLARVPAVLYFHENQFGYPGSDDSHNLDRQITSLYSAMAADALVFNSAFNRTTFLDGVAAMLSRMPDHVPAGIVASLAAKSRIMPVPIDDNCLRSADKSSRFTVVWNHRWEFDKGPASLLRIMSALIDSDMDFECHLLGQQFRQIPDEMSACVTRLEQSGRLGHCGLIEDREAYLCALGTSHLVLSTALHEFQGLAVLEAVAAGCVPVVPDRLAYQELFDAAWRYGDEDQAVAMIRAIYQRFEQGEALPVPDVSQHTRSRRIPDWQALLDTFDPSHPDSG